MRIGINASFLRKPGTGIGQVTLHFLKKLIEGEGYTDQSTFVLYTEEPVDWQFPSNFEVRSFLPWWKRDDLIRKWLWERQISKEAKKDGCDVFLSLYQTATFFEANFHHTMVVHDLIPRLFPVYQGNMRQKWYWRAVERGILKASCIVTISEATKNDLIEFGRERDSIEIAYPDTAPLFLEQPSLEDGERVLQKYNLKPGYIYHGGGLEIRKNGDRLLSAYAMLLEKERANTGLTVPLLVISGRIFSEQNPLATPIRSSIKKLGLEGRVRLLDFVPEEDLPALYKQSLFFVYPSLYEGFGLPVLEALRMGTPVVTSDVSSLPEVALDAALYIDPENVSSLVSGMERLIVDSALRESLKQASSKGLSRFSWSNFSDKILQSLSNYSKSHRQK